jgi:AraC family transcriptional activator of pobA
MSSLSTPHRAVPHYSLYGEMPRQAAPDFVHVESLSLRSAQHDWSIAPHQHDGLAQAFWVAEGAGRVQLDTVQTDFVAPALLVIPAATAHGFAYRPGSEGAVLTLSAEFIAGLQGTEAARAFATPQVLPLTPAQADSHAIDMLFARLKHELEYGAPGMRMAVAALVQLIMVAIHRLRPPANDSPSAGEDLWQAFRAAVEQRFRVCHSVAELASGLPVTRGRLDAICRRHGGRTGQQVIHDRLVLEAQRSLIYTGQSVAAVAYQLGFVDPAYFSRFFVRETSETPGTFRKRHRNPDPGLT